MITRMLMSTGESVYPDFLSAEDRKALKENMKKEGVRLQCACQPGKGLFYGISADLRIIPLHQHYEHAQWCSRCHQGKRNSASVYSENGDVTVFLNFNPVSFSVPVSKKEGKREKEEGGEESQKREYRNGTEGKEEDVHAGFKEKGLPSYSLRRMVKSINHDAYAMRLMSGRYAFLTEEYFLNVVAAKLKRTYVHGLKKSLKDLKLEEDGFSFFYSRVCGIEEARLLFPLAEKKYGRFVIKAVLDKAKEDFMLHYGVAPEEYMQGRSLMAAGFIYERKSKLGKEYKCIGRLCLFAVTKNGLFAESLIERDTVEKVMGCAKRKRGQFLYPDTDEAGFDGILRMPKSGREGYVYICRTPKKLQAPSLLCKGSVPSDDAIEEFAKKLGCPSSKSSR